MLTDPDEHLPHSLHAWVRLPLVHCTRLCTQTALQRFFHEHVTVMSIHEAFSEYSRVVFFLMIFVISHTHLPPKCCQCELLNHCTFLCFPEAIYPSTNNLALWAYHKEFLPDKAHVPFSCASSLVLNDTNTLHRPREFVSSRFYCMFKQ